MFVTRHHHACRYLWVPDTCPLPNEYRHKYGILPVGIVVGRDELRPHVLSQTGICSIRPVATPTFLSQISPPPPPPHTHTTLLCGCCSLVWFPAMLRRQPLADHCQLPTPFALPRVHWLELDSRSHVGPACRCRHWPLLLVCRVPRASPARQTGPGKAPRFPLKCRSPPLVPVDWRELAWSVDKPHLDKP
jgi:hypothetical protein